MIRPPLVLLSLLGALALAGCGGSDAGVGSRPPDYAAALRDAPPRLAALYRQANELLPGGTAAFQKRLDELGGYPVVVNKWASWCGPCRAEFPLLQQASAEEGDRVAFLGIDANDSEAAAKTFLGEYPVPYPSYSDPDQAIADEVTGGRTGFPATAFYDASGERAYVHIGQYQSEQDLRADIRRYAR